MKKTLPQGKKKILSSETTYTPEENRTLQNLAADGIAYRVEKSSIVEEKQKLAGSATAINDKARFLKEKEEELKTDQEINEIASKALGLPSAQSYTEMSQENHELKQTLQFLQEDLHTVASNVGSEIMKEIPVRTDIDYSTVPEQPSGSVMTVIRNMINRILDPIIKQFEEMK